MPSSAVSERVPEPEVRAEPQAEAGPTVEELESRNAELEDRYRRALADLDNYRKRVAREVERRLDEGADALVQDWLELVDSVDRASATDGESFLPLQTQIGVILAREGIARVGAPGEPFDPTKHEAVAVVETGDAPDRTIVDVARSGFARGDRVLRPAQVTVARQP
jgi:molecular chaperone GrpE